MCSARPLIPTMFIFIFLSLVTILVGCGEGSNSTPVAKSKIMVPYYSSFTSQPSFIVYQVVNFERSYMNNVSHEGVMVVLALWEDGSVVWSSNGTTGGPPYMEATVDRDKIVAILKKINQRAVKTFGNKEVNLSNYGPDSSYTVMLILDQQKIMSLSSWHELYEGYANTVVTDAGVEALNGRSKESVLKQASPAYKEFLEAWSTIREVADSSVPHEGKENKNSIFTTKSN